MENQTILIRVESPSTGKVRVYEYRRHQVSLVPNDMLGRFELLVEVVDTGDEPLRKIALLASLKTGTYQEMQEMWASAYEKCNKPDSCGIEFTE